MKTKFIKKLSVSAVCVLLLLTTLLAFSDAGKITASASGYIKEYSGSINNNIRDHFDSSVAYKLPEGIKQDEVISVIVSFDQPAILDAYEKTDRKMSVGEFSQTEEAQAIRDKIAAQKDEIIKSLDKKNIEYKLGADYDTVLSGFEVLLVAKDYEKFAKSLKDDALPIISDSYNLADTQLVDNKVNFDESTGIFDTEDFGYDGSGMLIAVLDTGLDYTHSAFSPANFNYSKLAITKAEVAAIMSKHDMKAEELLPGLSVDDVYVNEKVPFSFDYADSDSDVYSLHNNHGTHVSGVIVGNDDVIRGVAPGAQLVSMKIFSDVRETAYTSWIMSALEDCVTLGVDVINMSLGTACGFSHATEKELVSDVYERIRNQGISLVVAASNSFSSAYGSEKNGNLPLTSNPDVGTVGSPSTYAGAISIASIDGVKTPYILFGDRIIYFDEATDAATEEKEFFEEILGDSKDAVEYQYVTIPGAGREADYTGLDVKGKIVLVERGFNTFEEKANAAMKMGAAGIIVYNNVSGFIKMNVGTTDLPACSIKQDDGEVLASQSSGTIKIGLMQTSGPFISDFSSWGPTPDLGIKPEITAHGGNILSAVTGGDYDRLSGTSMACPNMAGVIALMRQHVMEKYPNIAENSYEVNAYVNRLLMSTADVMINKNGVPYAVRKQGAGLANWISASKTPAYILTYEDGKVMDKSKLELGDDPEKSGVYTMSFDIKNFENSELKYALNVDVMTEGVSDTKTSHGETTVTQDGYLLNSSVDFTVSNGGTKDGDCVVVPGGSTVTVTVTVTLSDEDKEYLNKSFENGMYVEGFIRLAAKSGTDIDLGVPYLAFYGDWFKAPLFDLEYFETSADELDDSIDVLDKTLADSYATRPIGGIYDDYIGYLGSYYFVQDPASTQIISANKDYIALSNSEGTIHSLRFVWAGLLRNAQRIEISIIDDSTGETVFKTVDYDVRKSYGDGGSIYPSNVEIEFDAAEHNLKNNTEYTVRLEGFLDYGDNNGEETSERNEKNVFEFPLVADFEAPAITDCEFYTEYDKELKKNRLYARMSVYDNHYTMAMMLGYVAPAGAGDEMDNFVSFDRYLTPVYSVRDGVTYVEYELTDFIQDIKNYAKHKNTFVVTCYDYALNEATYEIALPDEYIDFYFEDAEITLSPNEVYSLDPIMYPDTEWGELLYYNSSNKKVAKVVNDKIIALSSGTTVIYAYEKNPDGSIGKTASINVTVLKEGDEGYRIFDKPVADVFTLTGYDTLKAYLMLNTEDKMLGDTGDYRVLDTNSLEFYPSESIKLHYKLDAYFPETTEVIFTSNNEKIVTVDKNGVITAQAEGYTSITVSVLMDGRSTYYSQSINIEVKDPFVTTAPSLTHYYGLGGIVEIPGDLLITQIGDYAFSNFNYVPKDENDIISEDEPDLSKIMYIGDSTITKVIIPEGVKKIGAYAFANLTALKEVVLPSTLESIEYGAFYGCTSLTTVKGIEHVMLINNEAFAGCNLSGTLSLDNARAIGDYAFSCFPMSNGKFAGQLKEIILPETLQSIGAYAFYGNSALEKVTVNAVKVKYGPYVFSECESLKDISINADVIPTGAFDGAEKLQNITIGPDVLSIGEFAFRDTAITGFTVAAGNKTFAAQTDKSYLLSADKTTLLMVAPKLEGEFKLTDKNITAVGQVAFASNGRLTSIELPYVTRVEEYAFAYCDRLVSIKLGKLTHIGEYAFFRTDISEMPDFSGVSEIGAYAFGWTAIKELNIPDNMMIGEGAFCECDELHTIVIGDNVKIGDSAFLLGRDNNSVIVKDPDYAEEGFYSFEYLSALKSLTIGKNAVIGNFAFLGAAKLETLTLGEGAVIGDQAFYNACSLKSVDLSKVITIGVSAFSGDEIYMYADNNQNNFALDKEGRPVLKYYVPLLTTVDLSSAESIGEKAFLYCSKLETVILGDKIKEIPAMAFYDCHSLKNINTGKIITIGTNAFVESGLEKIDLSSAEFIDKYAFVYCDKLVEVTLNEKGTEIMEGAFAYCHNVVNVENLNAVTKIGPYAFAYTGIVDADLSGAVSIGDHAFLKETLTAFKVKLGEGLVELGDNPFAMCKLAPFSSVEKDEFNGKEYEKIVYTFDIGDNIHIIDGSLYCDVPNGMELIVYAGIDDKTVTVAEGTVRISAYAFAGSDVVNVSLPLTLRSIGHKAFHDCNALKVVEFKSYEAPNLEEEFDQVYFDSFDNLPASGKYDFTLWNGDLVTKDGLGIVPFYMWNISNEGKYSNVYYGANFVDYIGKTKDNFVVMVCPTNGLYYDTFIYGQYFALTYEGPTAPDDITLAAIEAINKLQAIIDGGENIGLKHEQLVIAARTAYDLIATKDQQALVYNYSVLLSAEDRINALKDTPAVDDPATTPEDPEGFKWYIIVIIVVGALAVAAGIAALVIFLVKRKKQIAAETVSNETQIENETAPEEAEQGTNAPEAKETDAE